jgi:hypothetical protein
MQCAGGSTKWAEDVDLTTARRNKLMRGCVAMLERLRGLSSRSGGGGGERQVQLGLKMLHAQGDGFFCFETGFERCGLDMRCFRAG